MDIWSLLYPPSCFACAKSGSWLCLDCSDKIVEISQQSCPGCYRLNKDGMRHTNCSGKSKINQLVCALYYRDPVKKIIINAKYHYLHYFSHWVTPQLIEVLQKSDVDLTDAVIVPVPSDFGRFRQYGYHFAHILAWRLSRKLNIKYCDCLKKTKSTAPQVGLKRAQRLKQVSGLIKLKKQLPYKRVLLVDDVFTTGATMNECARAIKSKYKNIKVIGVAVARG